MARQSGTSRPFQERSRSRQLGVRRPGMPNDVNGLDALGFSALSAGEWMAWAMHSERTDAGCNAGWGFLTVCASVP